MIIWMVSSRWKVVNNRNQQQQIKTLMYNKLRNSNNAQTYQSIPLKIKQPPHLSILGSKKLMPVPQDTTNPLHNAYRKDSQRYTCYQTYPQYEHDRDDRDSVGLETNSACPSIENGMFENMLLDLHEEIKLKSDAFTVAQAIVSKQKQNIKTLTQQNNNLKQKLQLAYTRIRNLQEQLNIKTHRYDESTKKSITKTYITEKNIPHDEQPEPLKLISAQIFNDFAQNYQTLLNDLSNWVCKEQEEELDNSIFNKLQMHKIEVEELLFGKCEEEFSKTTLETLYENTGSEEKKKTISGCSSYNQYEQTIDMYKQYCNKLSSQLCESINYILELSKSLQKAHSIYTEMSKPQTLVPTELLNLITKQCNKIISNRFTELKNENLELISIIEEMIGWIEKNSKDGGQKFRSSFSAMY